MDHLTDLITSVSRPTEITLDCGSVFIATTKCAVAIIPNDNRWLVRHMGETVSTWGTQARARKAALHLLHASTC